MADIAHCKRVVVVHPSVSGHRLQRAVNFNRICYPVEATIYGSLRYILSNDCRIINLTANLILTNGTIILLDPYALEQPL